jgi:hypothetical protein
MMIIADDLHVGEQQGYPVVDGSRLEGDPSRYFNLKTILLYVSADYPAQRLACGFTHSGKWSCHYCIEKGEFNHGVNRCVHDKFYRWLPANDPARKDDSTPPPVRNHESVCMQGLLNEAELTAKLQHAARINQLSDQRRDTYADLQTDGVNRWCPLAVLYLFDVVWDFVFDIMHAADVFKRYIVPSMKGDRVPLKKAPLNTDEGRHTPEELERRSRINRASERSNAAAVQQHAKWITTTAEQKAADVRMRQVSGCPNQHFSGKLRIFQNTGSFKSADWIHFITTGSLHVLKPMLRGHAQDALEAIVCAFRLLLGASSDVDPAVVEWPEDDYNRRKSEMRILKLKIARLLCRYERGSPASNMPRIVHMLMHVPDLIFRWNAVRNMWCFFNERYNYYRNHMLLLIVY